VAFGSLPAFILPRCTVLEIDPDTHIRTRAMADSVQLPNEQETHVRFVIASVAKQSSALFGQSGLLRRDAPRNDGMFGECDR
jgi:hypothetical protein